MQTEKSCGKVRRFSLDRMRVMWRSAGSIIRKESCGRKMSEIRIQEVQEGAQLMDNTRGTVVSFRQCNTTWFIRQSRLQPIHSHQFWIKTHQRKQAARRMGLLVTYDLYWDDTPFCTMQGGVCDYISEREISQISFSSRCIILLGYNRVNDNRIKYSVEGE